MIAPNESYGDELNNWSIGIKITYGDTSFVFTGDAETDAEKDIIASGANLRADVWKAAHHGSDTSNSEAILEAVQPDYAVISCGQNNSYGHPNAEVLERFEKRNIQVFRTDQQGTITAYSDGTKVSWNRDAVNLSIGYASNAGGASSSGSFETADAVSEQSNQTTQEVPVEQTVHITKTGEKYHSAGCQYLRKSDIPISLSNAKNQGYTPCSKCSPPQ